MKRTRDKQKAKVAYLKSIGWQECEHGPTGCVLFVMGDRQCMVDRTGKVTERGTDYDWLVHQAGEGGK